MCRQFSLGPGTVSRDRSRVGHFRSAAGEQAYLAAYRDAMNLLLTPRSTLDLETAFGHVRLYEFGAASADRAAIPVVLLPGRTSGVPMWASNLPDLAAARITYALDALGDAGLSVQIQPRRPKRHAQRRPRRRRRANRDPRRDRRTLGQRHALPTDGRNRTSGPRDPRIHG